MPHYKLTSPSGKVYHGITTRTLNFRLTQHVSSAKHGSHLPLHAALRKYGLASFKVETLSDSTDLGELVALEIAAIARDNSFTPNGYNVTLGGEGCVGHGEFVKAAKAKNKAARTHGEEAIRIARHSAAMIKRRAAQTPEERASDAAKARAAAKVNRERRAAERALLPEVDRVRILAEEKVARSLATKAGIAKRTPEQVAQHKARIAAVKALRTPEQEAERKDRISIAAKKRWADPVFRAKVQAKRLQSAIA